MSVITRTYPVAPQFKTLHLIILLIKMPIWLVVYTREHGMGYYDTIRNHKSIIIIYYQ